MYTEGRNVEVKWVPGYIEVKGNETVDKEVKAGTEVNPPEEPLTLIYVRRLVKVANRAAL